ncbi:hypothetical protein [Mesobacillus foraminis]|uniref:Uncharacterized protein n=1 Tax=Mesobacillus foraminis TaxID=279826 RepID=A0A4R2BPN6_9BACI|nr:hypothetical protein [Mesobacillus foraminis]TCN27924.1 hypothetical protein EV146_101254 [Mesobacillus foraminis]
MGVKKLGLEDLTERQKESYILTVDDALKMLIEAGVSEAKDTQVISRWCREGVYLDAILIERGRAEERGWRINEGSLRLFIHYKQMTFDEYRIMFVKAWLYDQVKNA